MVTRLSRGFRFLSDEKREGPPTEIGLAEALDPKVAAVYAQHATGAKYLINPQKGLS